MQPQHTAFAPTPTADTSAASDAGFGAGFGAGLGTGSADHSDTQSGTGSPRGKSTSPTPRTSDIVAPTLTAIVEGLVAVRTQIHSLHAVEATLLSLGDALAEEVAVREHHTDHGESEHRALAAELAAAVHESDRTMAGRITRAVTLVENFSDVHHALQKGRISQVHANMITDAGMIITDDTARTRYAAAALEIAQLETPGRMRSLVKELAERFANRTLDQRHQEARSCRMVRVVELGDGMADLIATLPAVYAYGIKDRLNQMARGIKQHEQVIVDEAKKAGPAGSSANSGSGVNSDSANSADAPPPAPRIVRSMDQIRADLLTDMLLASNPNDAAMSGFTGIAGLRARVQVIVPRERLGTSHAAAAAGQSSESASGSAPKPAPATLAGYGPIDTHTARQLAGHAGHWEEITINPDTGTVLSVDTYRPNTKLKQFLRARDLHCRFPGCHTPTIRCDIDHTVDAALGGPTTSTNLAHLCRRHHTLKHHSRWSVTQATDGTLTWTSPLGSTYTERPPSTVKFRAVPHEREGQHSGTGPSSAPPRASRPTAASPPTPTPTPTPTATPTASSYREASPLEPEKPSPF